MNPRLFLFQCFLLLRYTYAGDIGQEYNPENEDVRELNSGSYLYKSFRSVDLISPAPRKAADSPECHDGNYILLTPRGHRVPHPAVTILDSQGELVWEQYVQGQPYNLKVQEYKGENVLTFWVGNDAVGGHGEGDYHVVSR